MMSNPRAEPDAIRSAHVVEYCARSRAWLPYPEHHVDCLVCQCAVRADPRCLKQVTYASVVGVEVIPGEKFRVTDEATVYTIWRYTCRRVNKAP